MTHTPRTNPTEAISAKARAVVRAWLDGVLHASDAAHVDPDAAAQLADTLAWTIQDAVDAERERAARIVAVLPDVRVFSNMWISVGGTRIEGAIDREKAVAAIRKGDAA